MKALNLPTYSFKIKSKGEQNFIFDPFRRKFVSLTPEEWVRQNFAFFLVNERNYPSSRIVIEKSLTYNRMSKRCDILIYDQFGNPDLLVECKAPDVTVNENVFQQISIYNQVFKVRYLLVTNGMKHYACEVDLTTRNIRFLKDIPYYDADSA